MSSAKKASIISYISVAFYIVTGFLYTPYLVQTLGVSDYGLYALSASLIGYFSLDFGIGAAQTRLTAKFIAEGRADRIRDMLGITIKMYTLIDLIILIILLCIYVNIEEIFTNISGDDIEKFKKVFLVTSLFVLINFPLLPIKGLYQAFDRVVEITTIDLIYRVISIILLFGALYLGWGLWGVVLINTSCNIIFQFIRLWYLYHKESLAINVKAKDKDIIKFIFSFSSWATVAMIADKFFFGIIPFLLAVFSTTKEVAYFAIVISLEGYILSLSKALSGIFLPRIMKMVVLNQDSEQITDLMIRVGRVQLYIVGIIIIGAISLGKEFIYHWLGSGFDKSYYCIVLVLIPCLFHLTQTIAEEMIYATNNVKYRAIANIIVSLLCVSSIILITPSYGAYGAAIGVFLSFTIAHNLIIDVIYQKKMRIDFLHFLRSCHFKILPVLLLAGVIGMLMQNYIPTPSFISFIIKGGVWCCLTIGLLWVFAFNSEEKNMIVQMSRIL